MVRLIYCSLPVSEYKFYACAQSQTQPQGHQRSIVKLSSGSDRHATFFITSRLFTGFYILLTIYKQCVMLEEEKEGWQVLEVYRFRKN